MSELDSSLLSEADRALVRYTLAELDASADSVVLDFYVQLFESAPSLRALFVRSSFDVQARMFRETLYLIADHLEDRAWLDRTLARLGQRHAGYGVTPGMFGPVEQAFVATLSKWLGARWNADVERAWRNAFQFLRDRMLAR